ncbi:MAG: DUF4377 domain-containing protein [Bacteroides sp.]|nr:DUF4377 domain-containing protein [Bacteroides sp.]
MGVVPMKCLLVKKESHSDWEYFYDDIEGFTHEPGYEYVIQVRRENVVEPPADQSNLKYVLIKEISKTKKESEGLPVR